MEKAKKIIEEFFNSNEWNIVDNFTTDYIKPKYYDVDTLNISEDIKHYLKNKFKNGIYKHQKKAIELFKQNKNICLTTSTASGKSLVFQIATMETLLNKPNSKVMAIYPLKALSEEQFERFKKLNIKVGKIDGSVNVHERIEIIKNSDLLIFTPDVIHAWLLGNLENKNIINFLENLELIILDEAHLYTGVFGSNSAYVFRRINHLVDLLKGKIPQYIVASATIKSPKKHLKTLLGLDFEIISEEDNTSGKYPNEIYLVEILKNDYLTALSDLFTYIIKKTNLNFISFVDSRKQTEYISTISSRNLIDKDIENEEEINEIIKQDNSIAPYRAGYEEEDRNDIQKKLNNGELRGVISTSALEAGIDIPHLDIAILVGIPDSATSLYQRIGRVGRQKPGIIIIIKDNKPITQAVFEKKINLFNIPLQENILYLENKRIEYIHVLCLARENGEHEQICNYLKKKIDLTQSKINFPSSFIELCKKEIAGEISTEFQMLKAQCGDDPNHFFPLRDIDTQYKVINKRGPNVTHLGYLSYSQVMREAYPGAIYYYFKTPYRVYNINNYTKEIEVRRSKHYNTKPNFIEPKIRPNFSEAAILRAINIDNLYLIETTFQISELIVGFKEKRGPNILEFTYPLNGEENLYFRKIFFARNYFTSGVAIISKEFNEFSKDQLILMNSFLYEAFKIVFPFENKDLDFGVDKSKVNKEFINENDLFLSIFDQTYGSLRLSGNFLDKNRLKDILEYALYLAQETEEIEINKTEKIINLLQNLIKNFNYRTINLNTTNEIYNLNEEYMVKILKPGSKGLNIKLDNEIFEIEEITYTPRGLHYKGKYPNTTNPRERYTTHLVPIENIQPIPGESEFGIYNLMEASFVE
jgi:DEAD/DEAH box helicase domain-containing protein